MEPLAGLPEPVEMVSRTEKRELLEHWVYRCANGYGISVMLGEHGPHMQYASRRSGTYELGVAKFEDGGWHPIPTGRRHLPLARPNRGGMADARAGARNLPTGRHLAPPAKTRDNTGGGIQMRYVIQEEHDDIEQRCLNQECGFTNPVFEEPRRNCPLCHGPLGAFRALQNRGGAGGTTENSRTAPARLDRLERVPNALRVASHSRGASRCTLRHPDKTGASNDLVQRENVQ